MYKRGLKLWSINTDTYYEEAVRLHNNGIFDYIELYVVPNTLDFLPKWKNLKIPFIIHAPHFAHGFNMAKEEKYESNLAIYKQVNFYATELNAPYIIFHGGIDGDINQTAHQLASFKDSRALIENKPCIALPNRMGGKFCRGYNPEEIALVKEISGCGFCFDFGHAICSANSQKKNPYDYCKQFLQFKPDMYHLTDIDDITSEFDSHPHLGKGQLDFNKIFAMIVDNAYVTFETVKDSKEKLDDFAEDMKWLKNFK